MSLLLLVCLSFFLFFNKLGGTSLAAWDEAWYAEIARNILRFKNPFLLYWNGRPYLDHPPFGFWLMALSFKILGINELAARLPMATAGFGSLILVFLISKNLFGNQWLALCSSLVLATMPWFWLRARTANLDVLLVFLLLVCFYLAIKSLNDKRFFPFLGLSFGLALSTKTLVAGLFLPVLAYILFPARKKMKKNDYLSLLILFFFSAFPWYLINFLKYGFSFLERNLLQIGLRTTAGGVTQLPSLPHFYFSHNLNLLQMGILLWYQPFLFSFLTGIFFLKERKIRIIYLWLIFFLMAFSLSPKTELWHLIPVYPALSLLIPVVFYKLGRGFFFFLARLAPKAGEIMALFFVFSLVLFTIQRLISGLYHDIVKTAPPSQEERLSRELGQYEGIAYFDDDYWPVAIFYSEKEVINIPFAEEINLRSLPLVFKNSPRPFLILTKDWLLKKSEVGESEYEILKRSDERILIRSK